MSCSDTLVLSYVALAMELGSMANQQKSSAYEHFVNNFVLGF